MNDSRKCRGRLLAASAAALVFTAPVPAIAQQQTFQFNIPAQPLDGALRAFARSSRQQILFDRGLVRGRRGNPVVGSFSAEEGLAALLAGSGLAANRGSRGAFVVVATRQSDSPGSGEGEAGGAAADSGSAEQQIVVTGTRIEGAAPVGSRVVELDREAILASGRGSAIDLLRLLPQVTSLGRSEDAQGGEQPGPGNLTFASGVNLRGLGADATLTLLNGHRVASSTEGGLVDISQVPLLGVERVEVLTDGASAIYGSDAVAGVVNFVFRSDFHGAETMVRYSAGDGYDQLNIGQAFGRDWGTGSAFLAVEYFDQSNLPAARRAYYTDDLRPFGGPDLRTNNGIPGTIIAGGITYAIPPGQNGVGLTPAQLVAGTANRQNRYAEGDVIGASDKINGVLTLRQEITGGLTFFLDALASRRETVRRDIGFPATLMVPRSNPFFVNPNPAATSTTVLYNYASIFGPLTSEVQQEDVTVHGGFELRLPRAWKGSLSALSSRSHGDFLSNDRANSRLANEALADTNPATAFNPFGDRGSNTDALAERIRGYLKQVRRFSLSGVNVQASGPVFSLPGGELRLAVGAESRKERLTGGDDAFTSTAAPAVTRLSLARRVNAVFAEAFAPLVSRANAVPGVRRLTVSAAVRGESYSDAGDTWNPKFGVEWEPGGGLMLSGTWGTSFKAPRLPQMVTATNSILVSQLGLQSGPANVIQLAGTVEGLQPEEAETVTIGLDYTPEWLPGLQVGVTWFELDYRNRILRPAVGEYIAALNSGAESPIIVRRNPTVAEVEAYYANPLFSPTSSQPAPSTIVAVVDSRNANLGSLRQSGFDVRVRFDVATAIGNLGLSADLTYLTAYEITRIAGGPVVEALNTINNPVDTRARLGVAWRHRGWRAGLFVNHVGDYLNTTITPVQPIDSWTTTDARLAYQFEGEGGALSGTSVALDIRNIFDADPPAVAHLTAARGYDAEQANPLGRVVSLTLSRRW